MGARLDALLKCLFGRRLEGACWILSGKDLLRAIFTSLFCVAWKEWGSRFFAENDVIGHGTVHIDKNAMKDYEIRALKNKMYIDGATLSILNQMWPAKIVFISSFFNNNNNNANKMLTNSRILWKHRSKLIFCHSNKNRVSESRKLIKTIVGKTISISPRLQRIKRRRRLWIF